MTSLRRIAAVILVTIPVAFVGGIAGLLLAGETWNVSSLVGLIGLFGIAVKVSREIDASCRHPVALYDSLVGRPVFKLPIYFGQKCHHVSHLFLLS